MCEFGAIYFKPTRLAGTLPGMESLSRRCCGGHYHEILQGTVKFIAADGSKVAAWRTSLAGAYPAPLCRTWAKLI
eukprot:1742192-Heterocapsa_arctica.AAC.1